MNRPFARAVLLAALFAPVFLNAQPLKRRGAIGVVPAPVGEAVARNLGLAKPEGVLVQQVIPGSTAAQIGLREADVLLTTNGKPLAGPPDLIALSQKLTEGETVTLTLLRGKEEKTLSGTVLPRAIPVADDLELVFDEFPFQKGRIRALVKRPKGSAGKKMPVVYFLQGAACASIAYLPPVDPYRAVTDHLARRGYAVFLVEKPGLGDCDGTPACHTIGYDTELDAFRKGYQKLLTYDWVDRDNVFLFGHSLGGITAPLLAPEFKPKGVIVYGTVLKPWHDYLLDVLRDQPPMHGQDYAASAERIGPYREPLHRYFFDKKSPQELATTAAHARALEEIFNFDGQDQLMGHHYTFWQQLNDHNLYAAWKATDAHVLAIFGEADVPALKPEAHEQIAAVVNRSHPGKGEYFFLPRTDHAMVEVGTQQDAARLSNSPEYTQYIRDKFSVALIEKLDAWMRSKI